MPKPTKQLQATAYHESGHCVVALYLGVPFKYVTIIEEEGALGHVIFTDKVEKLRAKRNAIVSELTKQEKALIESDIIIDYAGFEAEYRFTGRRNTIAASSDAYDASDWGILVHSSPDVVTKYLIYLKAVANDIVYNSLKWSQIKLLADELQDKKKLSYKAVKKLLHVRT